MTFFLLCLAPLIITVASCTASKEDYRQAQKGNRKQAVLVKPSLVDTSTKRHPLNYPTLPTPLIRSAAAIVLDLSTKEVLYAKRAYRRRAVASTQKLLTAMVAIDYGIDQVIQVPKAATRLVPTKLYLRTGAEYESATLVKSLLVKSANDVAYTIAIGATGSMSTFTDAMNRKAKSIGMMDSNFKNASGLTIKGQYSTPYDMALCAAKAYQYPYIRHCVKTRSMLFKHIDGREKTLKNTNRLLHEIPYCTGMKTGTTQASGYCLIASGELDYRLMIVGVFGATSKTQLLRDAKALLKWALER